MFAINTANVEKKTLTLIASGKDSSKEAVTKKTSNLIYHFSHENFNYLPIDKYMLGQNI